ncbi:S-layer homology domain-containing protein [Paenibacillus sp. YIM B09110]|uniref:S-layer homology domain-containing protein n=1 Tax=Paenibacillus sp. YIM B09110 TaxID=3126102 RepID=UPI00301BA1F6
MKHLKRRSLIYLLIVSMMLTLIAGPGTAEAAASNWIMVDGGGANGLNVNTSSHASQAMRTAVHHNILYAAWIERASAVNQVRVKSFNGTTWRSVDGGGATGLNINPADRALNPSLIVYEDILYLLWEETGKIRVKKYDGTSWISVDEDGLNGSASATSSAPRMAVMNNILYVAWHEKVDGGVNQIRVMSFDGTNWTSVDGGGSTGLNADPLSSATYPTMAVFNNALYVSWYEYGPWAAQVRVKKYDGSSWISVDGGGSDGINVNPSSNALAPELIEFDNALYATWYESSQIRVKKYDGASWTSEDGGGSIGLNVNINREASFPKPMVFNNDLYVTWLEDNGTTRAQIRVKKYDRTSWSSVDDGGSNGINAGTVDTAWEPSLQQFNGDLYAFWAEANGYSGQVRAARMLINADFPTISTQPANLAVNVGGTATLRVTAYTIDGGTLSYQWYSNTSNSTSGGTPVTGAIGASYNAPTATEGTLYYYVEVTNTNSRAVGTKSASVTSNIVSVTANALVNAVTPSIETQPADATAEVGGTATLSVSASVSDGGVLSYQWYSNGSNSTSGGTFVNGARSASYNVPTATAGTRYYFVVVTNTNASASGTKTASVISGVAQVTLNTLVNAEAPSIGTQPTDATVNVGGTATLSVAASVSDGGVLSYQWYSNDSNSTSGGTLVNGATSASYNAPTATAGTRYYYVEVTNTNASVNGTKTASVTSNVVSVTATEVLTYEIEAIDHQTASALTQGYGPGTQQTLVISVMNTGTGHLTGLSVAKGGADAEAFEISQPASTLNSGAPSTSFTVKVKDGLAAGSYTTTVTVSAALMSDRTFTVTQNITLPGVPASPTSLQAIAGDRSVALHWEAVEHADAYEIYVATASGDFSESVATVRDTNYEVTGLTNGVSYYFAVKASNSGGSSPFSEEASAMPATVPLAPTNVRASAGDKIATVRFDAPADHGGSAILRYEVVASPGGITVVGTTTQMEVTGLTNGTDYTFTVRAINSVGPGAVSDASHSVRPTASVTTSPPQTSSPTMEWVKFLVNGQQVEQLGPVIVTTLAGRTVITAELDSAKLTARLGQEKPGAVLSIVAANGSDTVNIKLNGQLLHNLEQKATTLVIQTEKMVFTLPAESIYSDAIVADRLGSQILLQDVKVWLSVGHATSETSKRLQDAAERLDAEIISPAITFAIKVEYGDKTEDEVRYSKYPDRLLAIAPEVDMNRITTAVALEPNGTIRHVPSRIVKVDGKRYVKISDLSNGTYAVIHHSQSFTDVEKHWSKPAVNDLGSRLILSAPVNGFFHPNSDITRAEFAGILVRSLGLSRVKGPMRFVDVKEEEWYSGAVQTAYAYGLISGFGDDTFRPNDNITREQAFIMLAKAMMLIHTDKSQQTVNPSAPLHRFVDSDSLSEWARSGAAMVVEAGLVSGRGGNTLSPKAYITRAEAAMIVWRLLQQAKLI